MGVKLKLLNFAITILKGIINALGGVKSTQISAIIAESLSPTVVKETDYGQIKFFCPGKLPEWRAQTLLTKEPETLEWISTFNVNDVLWDIGANVGVYSMYAAKKGNSVISFEPSPSNYFVLCRNIEINKLDSRILAYCVALNNVTKSDVFFMANTELGGALNSFGEATDWQGNPFNASLKQAMIGYSVDDFIMQFKPQFPNHIKIDVDGNENKIISGMAKTLSDKRLKSILVELDSENIEYCNNVIDALRKSGLELFKKEHAAVFNNTEYSKVYNHIFERRG